MDSTSKIPLTISRIAPHSVVEQASRTLAHICLAAILNGLLVGVSACDTSHELGQSLRGSDRETVPLEPISNRSFQAAHPITLSIETIALVLRGVLVRDDQGVLTDGGASNPEVLRTFPEEDVAFLAPS